MILDKDTAERVRALKELFPYVKKNVKATLIAMEGAPVTFRLLDPPLHEFVPGEPAKRKELAESLGIKLSEINKRIDALHESNPMMGHRGVRLGVTYPEISEMQMRAILEVAAELGNCKPEIMIPVTCDMRELKLQKEILERVAAEVKKKFKLEKLEYRCGHGSIRGSVCLQRCVFADVLRTLCCVGSKARHYCGHR